MTFWTKITTWLKSLFRKTPAPEPTPVPEPIPIPVPEPTPEPQTLTPGPNWPCVEAPKFFGHGYSGENEYRQQKIDAARQAGLDCLKVEVKSVPSQELAMHLLHYEHPQRKGYFLGGENWFNRAKAAGVTRYLLDVTRVTEWAALADRFKAYAPGAVAYIGAPASELERLGADNTGVKTTEAK